MTETRFHGDDALRTIWHDIVQNPLANAEANPTEGDVVERIDKLFGHGSAHRVVIAGPTHDLPNIAVEFLCYRSTERDFEEIYGHWVDTGTEAFEQKCRVVQLVDPFKPELD